MTATDDSDDSEDDRGSGILDTLLMPLRLPGRVVGDIESLSRALLSLQRSAEVHLASVDKRSGELVEALDGMRASVDRIEDKIDGLMTLEATIEERMDVLREDLNTRMLAVEAEVRGIRPPIEQMSRDVQNIVKLLPNPGDGPFARLRDTLTSS
jgi:chromosome segregation ATPase